METNKNISKHWHKINGILLEKKMLSERLFQFIIGKTGKNARSIKFICMDEAVIEFVKGLSVKSRIKIRFIVKSTQWQDKWFTDCVAMDVIEWVKSEKNGIKSVNKQLDMLEEIDKEKKWKNGSLKWGDSL
jgi:hypothetical protein